MRIFPRTKSHLKQEPSVCKTQKVLTGFDQPDVTVYKSQPGGSVTLYHLLCHVSRDSKMVGFCDLLGTSYAPVSKIPSFNAKL